MHMWLPAFRLPIRIRKSSPTWHELVYLCLFRLVSSWDSWFWLSDCLFVWLIDCLIGWFINYLIDYMHDCTCFKVFLYIHACIFVWYTPCTLTSIPCWCRFERRPGPGCHQCQALRDGWKEQGIIRRHDGLYCNLCSKGPMNTHESRHWELTILPCCRKHPWVFFAEQRFR